jgi:hypothetical protein
MHDATKNDFSESGTYGYRNTMQGIFQHVVDPNFSTVVCVVMSF